MSRLGEWYTKRVGARQARKAWNDGVPLVSRESAQDASTLHADYWTQWAKELKMDENDEYSPQSMSLDVVVHKDFWVSVMQEHGSKEEPSRYWNKLISVASMEGNLSIIEAFSQVAGLPIALTTVEKQPFVHPRVVNWQMTNGLVSQKHACDLLKTRHTWTSYSGWDAQEFVQGGPVILAWVLEWVKLPNTVINMQDGYAWSEYLLGFLDTMEAEVGERGADGKTTLKNGHQYRKHRAWPQLSDLATPLLSGPTLIMLHAVYERFGFDHKFMDAVAGRWTVGDWEDGRVCAVIYYMETTGCFEGSSWKQYLNFGLDERIDFRQALQDKADPVLFHMLELQATQYDLVSLCQTAFPFFHPEQCALEVAEQYDVGTLLE